MVHLINAQLCSLFAAAGSARHTPRPLLQLHGQYRPGFSILRPPPRPARTFASGSQKSGGDSGASPESSGGWHGSEGRHGGGTTQQRGTGKGDTLGSMRERAATIERELAGYRAAYFSEGRPSVSDGVFDSLQQQLEELRLRIADKAGEGSSPPPPRHVGAPVMEQMRKARHSQRMLSLAAVHSREELYAWHTRAANHICGSNASPGDSGDERDGNGAGLLEGTRWVVEPKVDGLAVRLTYKRRELQQAATRGDGAEGEDVTHNVMQIKDVPASVRRRRRKKGGPPVLPQDFEVRGEVYMTKENYDKVNEAQAAAGEEPFANPRNAAAGSLRLLDSGASRDRRLSFVAYQLMAYSADGRGEQLFASHWDSLLALREAGFPVSPDNEVTENFEAAVEAADKWMTGRAGLSYEADGVVLKVDAIGLQCRLGSVGADPRWAVAWKFPAAQVVTRLLDIEMSLGRTGRVTPIAVLEPVAIGGVTVSRASLHNISIVRKKGVKVGDSVVLERAGDVIPKVVGPLADLRTGAETEWTMPPECPACGSAVTVVSEKGSDVAYCLNATCQGQVERLVRHYAATCFHGIGKATIAQLLDKGLVRDVADLYELTAEQLLVLDGYQARKAAAHVAAVAAAKPLPLDTVLVGLAIPLIGPKAATNLADATDGSISCLARLSTEELRELPGFGPHMAASVTQWMGKPSNQKLLCRLQKIGVLSSVTTTAELSDASQQDDVEVLLVKSNVGGPDKPLVKEEPRRPFLGMVMVVTGKFVERPLSRREVQVLVESLGGQVAGSVTRKTNLVVAGSKPGHSKLRLAAKLNVAVIDETEFWRQVGESL